MHREVIGIGLQSETHGIEGLGGIVRHELVKRSDDSLAQIPRGGSRISKRDPHLDIRSVLDGSVRRLQIGEEIAALIRGERLERLLREVVIREIVGDGKRRATGEDHPRRNHRTQKSS